MPIFLLIGSFVAAIVSFRLSPAHCYRLAFLKAAIWHGVIMATATEWLSDDRALTRAGVIALWSGLAVMHGGWLGYALWARSAECGVRSAECRVRGAGLVVGGTTIVVAGIIVTASLCLLTALAVPTHNYDAMTYHLPRVMHWIQNQTVAHYPTHNLRQIAFSPGAAYILTHLQLLTGGDYAANCAQGIAYVGCIVGTSLIAQFSQNQKASQVFTALVCASIPMAIMQASTSQTDLLVSFWLVCGAYFALKPERSPTDWGWLALAIGLAILTKPTGILFGIPLLIPVADRCLRTHDRSRPQAFLQALLIPGLVILAGLSLSLPSYWRNFQTFGSPLGISGGTPNSVINLSVMLSNLLRNLALSLPLPSVWRWIQAIHTHILKLDVNDPATTYSGNVFDIDQLWWRILLPEDENMVGNPVHLLLLLGALIWMVVVAGQRRSPIGSSISFPIKILALCTLTGFLLMCALLKWQMWGNRLLLPFYVLNAPVIGCCLLSSLSRPLHDRSHSSGRSYVTGDRHALAARGKLLVVGLLLTIALTYSIVPLYSFAVTLPPPIGLHSIVGKNRLVLYFRGAGPMLAAPYNALVQRAAADRCATIGLELGGDDWEYPLWVLLASQSAILPEKPHADIQIKHVNVNNPSQSLPEEFPDRKLCGIFKIRGLKSEYIQH